MEQVYDLKPLLGQLAGSVPLWAWGLWMAHRWMKQRNKADAETKQAISGLHDKLNRIEIKLASQGVDNLKADLETLKRESVKNEIKIDALFKVADFHKRTASDR